MTKSTTHTDAARSVRAADERNGEPDATGAEEIGHDTPTGTDPDARYEAPGYEGKSFGQAVDQDSELADRLERESSSSDEAEDRFEEESAGAPTRERQGRPDTTT